MLDYDRFSLRLSEGSDPGVGTAPPAVRWFENRSDAPRGNLRPLVTSVYTVLELHLGVMHRQHSRVCSAACVWGVTLGVSHQV
jgi:hypothetical protein